MGLEAISRGFAEVLVCEKNPKAANIIKKNYQTLKLTPNLKIGDSLKFLKHIDKFYDVIYIDPPYESEIYEKVFEILPEKSIIIAEHSLEIKTKHTPIKEKNYGGKLVSYYRL